MATDITGEVIIKNVCIDIDSLLDTRLALLYAISPATCRKLISTNAYQTRVKDEFDKIAYNVFTPLYKERGKGILKMALQTGMFKLLKQHYGDIVTDEQSLLDNTRPTIYINTYPYELDSEEISYFTYAISKIIPKAPIEFIYKSNYELTPKWVSDNVSLMFKYDGLEWLELHVGLTTIINEPLLSVDLMCPALVMGTMKITEVTRDTFLTMMTSAGTLIRLSFIDASYFSFKTKKELTP